MTQYTWYEIAPKLHARWCYSNHFVDGQQYIWFQVKKEGEGSIFLDEYPNVKTAIPHAISHFKECGIEVTFPA